MRTAEQRGEGNATVQVAGRSGAGDEARPSGY